MDCASYAEVVAADVDDRLANGRDEVEAHLRDCPDCRRLRDEQVAVRELLRSRPLSTRAPASLRARIDDALERPRGFPVWLHPLRLPVLAATVAAVLLVLWVGQTDPDLRPLIDVYRGVETGSLEISHGTSAPAELERYFGTQASPGFPPTVPDLSSSGFRLVGGLTLGRDGTVSRVSVYRDDGDLVVCDRRRAEAFPVPLEDGERLFYAQGGVSFSIHRAGPEVCSLMSALPLDVLRARLEHPATHQSTSFLYASAR